MKKLISICMLLGSCLTMLAQATSLVVDNQTPGWLSSKINYGDQATVRDLKVTGYINATDLKFVGTLIQNRSLDGRLDLSEANVVSETIGGLDNYIGENCFGLSSKDTLRLVFLDLPRTLEKSENFRYKNLYIDTLVWDTKIKYFSASKYTRIKHLILGESVDSIPDNAFGYKHVSTSNNTSPQNYSDLESVTFSPSIRYIGANAFMNCQRIKHINVEALDNLEYLGQYAFLNTQLSIDSIYVPSKLEVFNRSAFPTKEGQHIFVGENVKEIYIYSWDCFKYLAEYDNSFWHMASKTPPITTYYIYGTVYIPKGAYDNYFNYYYSSQKIHPYDYQADHINRNGNPLCTLIEVQPVEKIHISQSILELEKENHHKLVATISPMDADNSTITWNSRDDNIASIDQNGVVTAMSPGTTWVYATNIPTGIQDSCKVTVIQHVTGIKLEPAEISFSEIGETEQLNAEVLPADATDKSVKWTSSNSSVCMVTESGHIVALSDGTAIIVATTVDGNYPATCVVKVDTTTGIGGTQLENGIVKTIGGITVQGLAGETVSVTNSQGIVVYRGVCNGENEQIALPKGLYIVKVGAKSVKIAL